MKKILLLLLIIISNDVLSQYDSDNLKKYWFYRYRFINHFTQVGLNPGESMVADIRNRGDRNAVPRPTGSNTLSSGDQTLYMGYYIGVLATEYKLLLDNGQDVTQTANELYHVLFAFNRLDINAEQLYGQPNSLNGFFLREDRDPNFPANPAASPLNRNLDPALTDYRPGFGTPRWVIDYHEAWPNNPPDEGNVMSLDQMCDVLMGLSLVIKCVPSGANFNGQAFQDGQVNFRAEARAIIDRMMDYMTTHYWMIWEPGGNLLDPQNFINGLNTVTTPADLFALIDASVGPGIFRSEMVFISHGLALAAGVSFGQPARYMDLISSHSTLVGFWWGLKPLSIAGDVCAKFNIDLGECDRAYNWRMALTMATLGRSWPIGTPPGVAPANTIGTHPAVLFHASFFDWGSYYAMLHSVLHGTTNLFQLSTVESQLNSAPCDGPFFHSDTDKAGGGWAHTGRWLDHIFKQNDGPPSSTGNFNGLDYMLLHNLYYIHNGSNLPAYFNLMDRVVTTDFPVTVNVPGLPLTFGSHANPLEIHGFRSVRYEGTASPGASVTFRAGEEVGLPDNFGADDGVEFGVFFEPFQCINNEYKRLGNDSTADGKGGKNKEGNKENEELSASLYGFADPLPQKNNHVPLSYEEDMTDAELMAYMDSINTREVAAKAAVEVEESEEEEFADTPFKVFPNPNSGTFTLYLPESTVSVRITDVSGKTVFEQLSVSSNRLDIDLSDHAIGMYFVKVQTGEQVLVEKVVLQ